MGIENDRRVSSLRVAVPGFEIDIQKDRVRPSQLKIYNKLDPREMELMTTEMDIEEDGHWGRWPVTIRSATKVHPFSRQISILMEKKTTILLQCDIQPSTAHLNKIIQMQWFVAVKNLHHNSTWPLSVTSPYITEELLYLLCFKRTWSWGSICFGPPMCLILIEQGRALWIKWKALSITTSHTRTYIHIYINISFKKCLISWNRYAINYYVAFFNWTYCCKKLHKIQSLRFHTLLH